MMIGTCHSGKVSGRAITDIRPLGIPDVAKKMNARIRERGAKRVYADILTESPEAFDFWRAMGFTPNEVVSPYAKNL